MPRIADPPWSVATDADPGRVVASRPAPPARALVRPRLYGRETFPPSDHELADEIRPKSLTARVLDDVIIAPNHLIFTPDGGALDPRTLFRPGMIWHGGGFLLEDRRWTPRYELPPTEPEVFDEPLYYVDTDFRDVYGHLLIELLPRLWALRHVDPRMRLVTSNTLTPVLQAMLAAAGVDPDRVLHLDRPMVAHELVVPDIPVWKRHWAHPEAEALFRRIAKSAARDRRGPKRVYLSRRGVDKRALANEAEVEELFSAAGFAIVRPETLTFAEQVSLVAGARCLAGTGGSAMHSAVFARPDARVLIVCSEGWFVNADVILSQVPGRLGYVFGSRIGVPADAPRGDGSTPWEVPLDDVRLAIGEHFGIGPRRARWGYFRPSGPSAGSGTTT